MKLIVTIPCYNEEENLAEVIREIPRSIPGIADVEVMVVDDGSSDRTVEIAREAGADHLILNGTNKGLAWTFKRALWEAVKHDADIIVNTDGDNHYDQSRIAELVTPILEGQADLTVGSRNVEQLEHMPFWNKQLNRLGSTIMTKWMGMPKYDVSTGFRGYSKNAAMRLGVYSQHTYVHTTLMSAQDLQLSIIEVPIMARKVSRKSRLIKNIPDHMWKAGTNILRNVVLFRPMRFFGWISVVLAVVGIIPIIRFLYFVAIGQGTGHIQSLILSGVLVILSFNSLMIGLLGTAIGWVRKISEDQLTLTKESYLKLTQYERSAEAAIQEQAKQTSHVND
jgi:glycosyltransferase involved in cell wall biosynthesis